MSIIHALKTDLEKGACHTDGSFLVSAITILCILFKVDSVSKLSEQDCGTIALLLRESYRPKKSTCPAYSALLMHLPPTNFRYC